MAQAYVDTLAGITDGTVAIPGTLGELQESVISAAVGSAFTIGQFGNVTSLALTPGDWWVSGMIANVFLTSLTRVQVAVSLFSGNTTTDHVAGSNVLDSPLGVSGGLSGSISVPNFTVNVSAATTAYLKVALAAAVGNILTGRLSARRMR